MGERKKDISKLFVKELTSNSPGEIFEYLNRPPVTFPWPENLIFKENVNPNKLKVVEIMGLPHSGKSSEVELLQNETSFKMPLIIQREFAEENWETAKKIGRTLNRAVENILLEEYKMTAFLRAYLETLITFSESRKGSILVSERGPNDVLVCDNWIRRYTLKMKEVDEWQFDSLFEDKLSFNYETLLPPGYSKLSLEKFFEALTFSQSVDGVILFQVSYDEGSRRRIAQGLEPEGRLHNPKVRPELESAYGWWLSAIYPLLSENSNTSLLIIDGDKPKDENHQKVKNFIEKL